jgi:hypothetical protein
MSPKLNMANVIKRIAKPHDIFRRISMAGTPSSAAKITYPSARATQIRLGIVKVRRSIDAESAMRMGKKAKIERWIRFEAIAVCSVASNREIGLRLARP